MKKIAIGILMLMITAGSARAGSVNYYLESQNYAASKTFVPQVQSLFNYSFNENWGAYAFSQWYPTFAQAYAGPSLNAASWLQLGIGGGLEQSPQQWRTNAFAYLSHGSYSALLNFEYGKSGYYYLADLEDQVNPTLSLGIFAQRFTGIGPKAVVSIPSTPLSIWIVPSYDPESKLFGGVASLRATIAKE